MPVTRTLNLTGFQGVAAGQTATINLPRDIRYHGIYLKYGTATAGGATEANIESEVTAIRLNIDGRTQWDIKPAELYDIRREENQDFATGFIPLDLTRPYEKSLVAERAPAWGMAGVNNFQLEVDIASGATTPTLSGFMVFDDVREPPQGIIKLKRRTLTVSATGEHTFIHNTKGDAIRAIHLFEASAGQIDTVDLTWDGVRLSNLDPDLYKELLKSHEYTPVSGLVTYIPGVRDLSSSLPMLKGQGQLVDLQMTLTVSATGNITMLTETLGLPD